MGATFKPKVCPQNMKVGDTVVKAIQVPIMGPRGQLSPHCTAYVKVILLGGAVKLMCIQGCELP